MIGFSRTLRALERERSSLFTGLSVALLVLAGGWGAWLGLARTKLYVLSDSARLEAIGNPMPVQAPVDGVVTASTLTLGRAVSPGDVLFQLDARSFELQRDEAAAKLYANRASLAAVEQQMQAEERAREASASNVRQTSRAARARVAVAETTSEAKRKESELFKRLGAASLASGLESLKSAAEAEESSAQARASQAEALVQMSTGETGLRDREVRIAMLAQQIVTVKGEIQQDEARVATLDYEIERRTIRAAGAGVLADVVPLPPGATIGATTRVATIVPTGDIRIVARFAPEEAIGRIAPSQPARVRLDNFPWTQYGTVTAVVSQVGNEPRGGTVRVELAVLESNERIPIGHGLTGTVEVEVDELSPLELLLRLSGQKLTAPRPERVQKDAPSVTESTAAARVQ